MTFHGICPDPLGQIPYLGAPGSYLFPALPNCKDGPISSHCIVNPLQPKGFIYKWANTPQYRDPSLRTLQPITTIQVTSILQCTVVLVAQAVPIAATSVSNS